MKPRYVVSLEVQRKQARSAVDAAFFDLEIAGYDARKGRIQQAQEVVTMVRSTHGPMGDSRLLAQLNFVEGLVCHCSGHDDEAAVKWERATAIGAVGNCVDVLAKVSGWMAFVHYTSGRFLLMFEQLKRSLVHSRSDSVSGALTSRARMVVALVLHTCRRTEDALLWYEASRRDALTMGDDVELAALAHNMAWIRVYNYRNALLRGEPVPAVEARVLRVASEAAQSYEELVGLASFPALTPLLRAQNFLLSDEYSHALAILDEHAEGVRQQGLARLAPNFSADRAYCLVKLGQSAAADEAVESLLGAIDSSIHADDLAVLYSRLRDCAEVQGRVELHSQFADKAQRAWRAFDAITKELLQGVHELISDGLQLGDSVPRR